MKVKLLSIPVLDQENALKFYTEKLGLLKKKDEPLEGGNRWITIVSKDDPNGPEILLEPAPNHFEPSKVYQRALLEAGIPCAQLYIDQLDDHHKRLSGFGVEFTVNPTKMGTVRFAIINDTCGNLIQLIEEL